MVLSHGESNVIVASKSCVVANVLLALFATALEWI